MQNKKVLVTGGCGFIGSNIVKRLLELGASVKVFDNLSTGYLANIKEFLDNPNFELIIGDITCYKKCKSVMHNIDIVCHQAALGSVPRSINKPLDTYVNNVNGFLNILLAANKMGVKKVVYASSSSVYGDVEDKVKTEERIGIQLSPYAISKRMNEMHANNFWLCYGLKTIGLRYFNVFGPKQNKNGEYAAVIPKFVDAKLNNKSVTIYGDGEQSRDFTYVDNVVEMNIKAMLIEDECVFGEVFNVGCGNSISVNYLKEKLELNSNYDVPRKGDVNNSCASLEKSIKLLDYKVFIDFDEGIDKYLLWLN